jgi:hypothetical protein
MISIKPPSFSISFIGVESMTKYNAKSVSLAVPTVCFFFKVRQEEDERSGEVLDIVMWDFVL